MCGRMHNYYDNNHCKNLRRNIFVKLCTLFIAKMNIQVTQNE